MCASLLLLDVELKRIKDRTILLLKWKTKVDGGQQNFVFVSSVCGCLWCVAQS